MRPQAQESNRAPLVAVPETERITRLESAVFGIPGTEGGGVLNEMQRINAKLSRLNAAVIGAALSFGVGSLAVCVTLVSTSP